MKKSTKPKAYSYIRFSTPSQKHGDSERRQIESAQKYAEKNDLELDSTLNLKDEGLSGYTGKHIKEGNLGKFLALIESGQIPKGSRLIIESIDRLGRQEPFKATETIRSIVEHGIMLVVLDWFIPKEYTYDSIRNNPGELSGIVTEVERAYFESKKKADRLSKAWEEKRTKAEKGEKKLTAISPKWLQPVRGERGKVEDFQVIEEIANDVQLMFELKEKGFGNNRIAKRLKNDWGLSTIQRYMGDIRVLGLYQPHTKKNGKRVPVGDPIENYYPQIIDQDLFYSVQNRIEKWKAINGYTRGRTGKHKNVFQGRLICGECGGRMHFDDKGKPPKGGQYIRCENAKRARKDAKGKRICKASWVRYSNFFEAFFKYVKEVDVSKLLPDSNQKEKELNEISRVLAANQNRLETKLQEKSNLVDSIATTSSKEVRVELENKLGMVISEIESLEDSSITMRWDYELLSNRAKELRESFDNTISAQQYLEKAKDDEEQIDRRLKLKIYIAELMNRIVVYPSKESPIGFNKLHFFFNGTYPYGRIARYNVEPDSKFGSWSYTTRNKAPKGRK